MSNAKPPRQFFIGDGFAVSCEFDPATNTFDFTLSNGGRKAVSFPEATSDEVAKALKDIEGCCPLTRKDQPNDLRP